MSQIDAYLQLTHSIDGDFQKALTASDAISLLQSGNDRFLSEKSIKRNRMDLLQGAAEGQAPYAAVLGCIDSRAPIEELFDAEIGDLFVARVAGNTVNEDILGSLEYACKYAGSKAILVLGHTQCGAVKGTYAQLEDGNLTGLLQRIEPAVTAIRTEVGSVPTNDAIDRCVASNVDLVCERIRKESSILREMESRGDIIVAGAIYDVATGKVSFRL
jgi:carbonic anhydrase|tara:strand:- start:607 stop:1254 length:648 start_codon:yes stop_codon:yes gene_type:complete